MSRQNSRSYPQQELDDLDRIARARGGRHRFSLQGAETQREPTRAARAWLENGGLSLDRLDDAQNGRDYSRARSYLRLDALLQTIREEEPNASSLLQALERELAVLWRGRD
jgi:hypothetical protein